jgi:hypothetical protein
LKTTLKRSGMVRKSLTWFELPSVAGKLHKVLAAFRKKSTCAI